MQRYILDPAMRHENATQQAVFTGSITGAVLTVTAMISGSITRGDPVLCPSGEVVRIYTQGTGTGTGGTGTYTLLTAPSANVPSQVLRSGRVQIPFSSIGAPGYWNTGPNGRDVFTTTASYGRIRAFSTAAPNPYGQRTYPTQLPYRVNGRNYWASVAQLGDEWYDIFLPGDGLKTVEIFTPIQNAIVFGQSPVGVWPMEVEFNAPATVVAPYAGNHLVVLGDSIDVGGYAPSMVLQGWTGIAKRGASDKYLPSTSVTSLPRYKGAYSAGTLYAVNDVVLSGGATWIKASSAAAGTTPAIGSDWTLRGYDGRVTLEAYGSRRIYDDCSTTAAQTTFAGHIAALAPTQIVDSRGTNDWAAGFANAAALQAAYLGWLNALAVSSAAATPLLIITPKITTSRETASYSDMSLPNIRTAITNAKAANAAGATPKASVTLLDGSTIGSTANLVDGIHWDRAGHQLIREAVRTAGGI